MPLQQSPHVACQHAAVALPVEKGETRSVHAQLVGLLIAVPGRVLSQQIEQLPTDLPIWSQSLIAHGDACLQHKFNDTADASARIAVQNALFAGRQRLSALTIPWCTYTDPELARTAPTGSPRWRATPC